MSEDQASDPPVLVRHCLGPDGSRYCAPGMRAFAERHGLSMRALLRGQLLASELEATGDAMAIAAARRARQEAQRG